jgi:hypothetical protein
MAEASQIDPTFPQRVDEHIALCNSQMKTIGRGAVATSTAYAAARFAIWSVAVGTHGAGEFRQMRQQTIDSFVDGFRAMLSDEFDQYAANYDAYQPAKPGVITR